MLHGRRHQDDVRSQFGYRLIPMDDKPIDSFALNHSVPVQETNEAAGANFRIREECYRLGTGRGEKHSLALQRPWFLCLFVFQNTQRVRIESRSPDWSNVLFPAEIAQYQIGRRYGKSSISYFPDYPVQQNLSLNRKARSRTRPQSANA